MAFDETKVDKAWDKIISTQMSRFISIMSGYFMRPPGFTVQFPGNRNQRNKLVVLDITQFMIWV